MAARPRRVIAITLLLIGLIALWRFTLPQQAEPEAARLERLLPHGALRVGIDPSNPPFAMLSDEALVGLEVDLGHAIAGGMGAPVQFTLTGFDGVYDLLIAGGADLVIAALTINPLRTGDIRYTSPYFDAGLALVIPADSPIAGMADLSGRALAYALGTEADLEARRWLRRIHPFETRPYERPAYALDAARLGEAHAALVDQISARLYQAQHPGWESARIDVTYNPYVIAMRRDQEELFALVEASLNQLRADGTLDRIIEHWFEGE